MKKDLDPSDYIIGTDSIYMLGRKVYKEIYINTNEYNILFEDMVDIPLNKPDNLDDLLVRSRLLIADYDKPEPLVAFESVRGCKYDKNNNIIPKIDIDINNIAEKVSNTLNNSIANASISNVEKDKKFNIKLKDCQNRIQEFDLIPEEDGKVLLIDDIAYLFRGSQFVPYRIPPEAILDRLISKYVYINNCMIVRDYSTPQVFSYSYNLKDVNLKVNYKQVKDFIVIDKNTYYSYPRDIVTNVEIYEDGHKSNYSLEYDNLYSSYILDNSMIYNSVFDKCNRCVSYNKSAFKDSSGNMYTVFNTIYPISYINILGFIFMDNDKYRIYCNDIHKIGGKNNFLTDRTTTYYKVPRDKEEEFFKAMN